MRTVRWTTTTEDVIKLIDSDAIYNVCEWVSEWDREEKIVLQKSEENWRHTHTHLVETNWKIQYRCQHHQCRRFHHDTSGMDVTGEGWRNETLLGTPAKKGKHGEILCACLIVLSFFLSYRRCWRRRRGER